MWWWVWEVWLTLHSEEVEEVPRQGGDVGDVQGAQVNAPLQHELELLREREGDLGHHKAAEEEVDPGSRHDLRERGWQEWSRGVRQ